MRTAQRPEIDRTQPLLVDQVDHRERVVGAATVVGDVREFPVRRSNYFVRILADRNCAEHLKRAGIDDCERMVALRKHQERIAPAVVCCVRRRQD